MRPFPNTWTHTPAQVQSHESVFPYCDIQRILEIFADLRPCRLPAALGELHLTQTRPFHFNGEGTCNMTTVRDDTCSVTIVYATSGHNTCIMSYRANCSPPSRRGRRLGWRSVSRASGVWENETQGCLKSIEVHDDYSKIHCNCMKHCTIQYIQNTSKKVTYSTVIVKFY